MRRGRYGNRVSFRVAANLPEGKTTEEVRHYLEWLINAHSYLNGVQVKWPADYHGRYKDVQKDVDARGSFHLNARQEGR